MDIKDSDWEFSDRERMFDLLAGDFKPDLSFEKRFSEYSVFKFKVASTIIRELGLNKSMTGIEIGAGCGLLSNAISQQVKTLNCVDISQSFLDFAKDNCPTQKNINFIKVNSAQFDFADDNSQDFILSSSVFIHLNLYDIFWHFQEARRVLKREGVFSFEILEADRTSLSEDTKFLQMAGFFKTNPKSVETLFAYHSKVIIDDMELNLGFSSFVPEKANKHATKTRLFYKKVC